MKRCISASLVFVMMAAIATVPAAADVAVQPDAYIDSSNRAIMVLGAAETMLPFNYVDAVVNVTDTSVYLTAPGAGDVLSLYRWDMNGSGTQLIAQVSGTPVFVNRDNAIYYLDGQNTRQLMKMPVKGQDAGRVSLVRILPSDDAELREAMDGLYISMGSGWSQAFSRILDSETMMMRPTAFDPDAVWQNFGEFETQLTTEGGLELRMAGSTDWQTVTKTDNVTAQAAMDGVLYYMHIADDGSTWIRKYDPSAENPAVSELFHFPGATLQSTMLAGEGAIFLIDGGGNAIAIDAANGSQLNLWRQTGVSQNAQLRLCSREFLIYEVTEQGELLRYKAPVDWLLERTYRRLAYGSRGSDVSDLQTRFIELGYPTGWEDGIFGPRTQRAVFLFQDAIYAPLDGVASENLQKLIFADDAPRYVEYIELRRGGGHNGIRVREMQQRLRNLGYLAYYADGIYGPRTEEAIRIFQRQHGLAQSGVATVDTLQLLYSGRATFCSSFIDLYRGDSGIRVKELQQRLQELGYYLGRINSEYDSKTADAVRMF